MRRRARWQLPAPPRRTGSVAQIAGGQLAAATGAPHRAGRLEDKSSQEMWTEVANTVKEAAEKHIPKKRNSKKAIWLSVETVQVAEERRKAKIKGDRSAMFELNKDFQKLARRDKNIFFNEQCKEVEDSNGMGKTRDLYKKIREIKGKFQAKIGMIKDRNGKDLSDAEDVKEIWAEYVDLYKKDLHHDRAPNADVNVNLELEPDILESDIQWVLENMADNKTSGQDEIPAELFKVTGKDAHQRAAGDAATYSSPSPKQLFPNFSLLQFTEDG
ncbi:uncharacterized protein LOC126176153 [Schistocerca cancellata]|uniref:uncharacterized protein LOC126176153 n=1 Tax=Schistocerca cancellata TaxID=274614 RepID=UPI0021186AB2|nr:uncharacterized protein LOC126176153 [Schistocerca cancellata]